MASTGKFWESAKNSGSADDRLAASFVESLSFDTRLYDADIRGSLAHVAMLCDCGLVSAADGEAIRRGLTDLKADIEAADAGPRAVGIPGAWAGWRLDLEDVHMCIEAALIERIGEPGRRLHTGRSRNDQVALDIRLWIRDASVELSAAIDAVKVSLEAMARRQGDGLMPMYTHLQRAQPGCIGAECMAWWAMLERVDSLLTLLRSQPEGLGASPLGSGAVAGSGLGLDRAATAALLSFAGPGVSSIDATASRDEVLDFAYALTRIALTLSRWAEQWILYCSTEFSFLKLAEVHTTGSSMMPQKRNPDMLELIRGRTGTAVGSLSALLTIVKGLPLAYNRDLQEDKRHLFASYDSVFGSLRMAAAIINGARFDTERIAATLDEGFLDATGCAEFFVTQGVPFRTAHQVAGALVRRCGELGLSALSQLPPSEFQSVLAAAGQGQHLARGVGAWLTAENVVTRYRSAGHAGPGAGGYRDWLHEQESKRRTSAEAGGKVTQAALFETCEPSATATGAPEETRALIEAYVEAGRTLDDLPYTEEFARLLSRVGLARPLGGADDEGRSPREVLRRLHNLRKAGKLPRSDSGRAGASIVKVTPAEEKLLEGLVIEAVGTLGQRDQLPLTPQFDSIVERFNAKSGRQLDAHAVWRLVAKLAK